MIMGMGPHKNKLALAIRCSSVNQLADIFPIYLKICDSLASWPLRNCVLKTENVWRTNFKQMGRVDAVKG